MLDGPDVLNLLNILMVLHIVSHPPKVDTQILNFHMPSSVARGRVTQALSTRCSQTRTECGRGQPGATAQMGGLIFGQAQYCHVQFFRNCGRASNIPSVSSSMPSGFFPITDSPRGWAQLLAPLFWTGQHQACSLPLLEILGIPQFLSVKTSVFNLAGVDSAVSNYKYKMERPNVLSY